MSEPSIHNVKQREKLTELIYEEFGVKNFFVVKSGVLSCFSSGRSTALILDTGKDFFPIYLLVINSKKSAFSLLFSKNYLLFSQSGFWRYIRKINSALLGDLFDLKPYGFLYQHLCAMTQN
jgi:hypothetical protein